MIVQRDIFGSSLPRSSDARQELIKVRQQLNSIDSDDFSAFGFDYFDNQNYGVGYGGYRYDGRYRPAVLEMIDNFSLKTPARILELGCAKGFILYEFHQLGYEVYGIDISDYAVEHSMAEISEFITCQSCVELDYPDNFFDLVYSKEMLPHLTEMEIDRVITSLNRVSKNSQVFLEIQIADTKESKELVYAWDKTHQTVKNKSWWLNKLEELDFNGTINFKPLF